MKIRVIDDGNGVHSRRLEIETTGNEKRLSLLEISKLTESHFPGVPVCDIRISTGGGSGKFVIRCVSDDPFIRMDPASCQNRCCDTDAIVAA